MSTIQCKALLVALFLVLSSGHVSAQYYSEATKEHKVLAQEVGTWDAKTKMWMAPGTPPLESTAEETNKLLGGKWLMSEFKGDMGGMPFTGHGQFGYDPVSKKYTGTWIDSTSPFLSVMEGTMDEKSKTLTMMSKGRDPMTGKESLAKMVSTYTDEDHKTFEMFMPVPGNKDEWWKMMEVTYTRRK